MSALSGLILAVAVATALLQAVGTGGLSAPRLAEPDQWGPLLSQRDPLVAAMALFRLVALGTGWYLLAVGVLGLALRLLRAVRLVSIADKLTPPAVRRLLVSAAGAALATGVNPSLALASGPQLPAAVARPAPSYATAAGQLATTTTTTTLEEPARPPPTVTMRLLPRDGPAVVVSPPGPTAEQPDPTAERAPARDAGGTWRVRPGECFWSIAEDVLAESRGRPASDAEIVPYWKALIEANRVALADKANPDLVSPGQLFTLPAVTPG